MQLLELVVTLAALSLLLYIVRGVCHSKLGGYVRAFLLARSWSKKDQDAFDAFLADRERGDA